MDIAEVQVMAWLQIEWQLTIEKPNEYEDEPGLRFAVIGIVDGLVRVHSHPTGRLTRSGDDSLWGTDDTWSGEVRHAQPLADEENPYFGFVVQTFEHDGSSPSDRRKDDRALSDTIEQVCQEVVDSGGIPQTGVVWAAANAPRLTASTDGVDHWIGASAWVDMDYGRRIARHLGIENRYEQGEVIAPKSDFSRKGIRFPYGDAVYSFEWERRLIAGPLDEGSPFTMQGWSNASWVR